jgi:hypothetical protein
MRVLYAIPIILVAPVLGAVLRLNSAGDTREMVAASMVCQLLQTAENSGSLTAASREKLLSEMIGSPILEPGIKHTAERTRTRC